MMTSITTPMLNNEYWNKMSYDSSYCVDDFPADLINDLFSLDADCFTSFDTDIRDRNGEELLSSYNNQRQIIASSSNSPPIESHSPDLLCGVCSAPAHGYNFDQITCESCKAFFRRNALKNMPYLKCRFSGQCEVNIQTRRQCTYCRLKKCFDINMRKDWIRTEEERESRQLNSLNKEQRKLNKLSPNQKSIENLPIVIRKKKRITKPVTQELVIQKMAPIYTVNTFNIHRNLCDNDKIVLNNITNAYQYGGDQADFSHIKRLTETSTFSQFLRDESKVHESLIYFYKHVPEFKEFDLTDQILLIKCNMVNIIHLHHIILQNFNEIPQIGAQMSTWITPEFHRNMSRTRQKFDCFMKYPLILKISLIVFVFSMNLSTPRGYDQMKEYKNKRKLYQCQNYYISILWGYLNYLFDENEAAIAMQTIVMQILRYQTLMHQMDDVVRKMGDCDIFTPLMQSVFGLT